MLTIFIIKAVLNVQLLANYKIMENMPLYKFYTLAKLTKPTKILYKLLENSGR